MIAAIRAAVTAGELGVDVPATVTLERPRNKDHGDYATNAALQLAKPAGRPPREVAEIVAQRLRDQPGIDAVDVAGPGFLNIRLSQAAQGELARTIVVAGDDYGRTETLAKERINLEFVSANPTGPVHLGHTRWAALGDSLRRLLEAAGADVTSEHYVNDAGSQMDKFGESLLAAARGRPTPDDGYAGDYVADGEKVEVPPYVGFVTAGTKALGLAPLHTHQSDGIIHIENSVPATFVLGQFFVEWGVRLSATCIGGLCASGSKELAFFVNGRRYTADPTRLVLKEHEEIAIEYGDRGHLPTPPSRYAFGAN